MEIPAIWEAKFLNCDFPRQGRFLASLNALYKAFHRLFKALKTSGFYIEDTHLTDIERASILLSLELITYVWVYKTGIYLDSIKPIKVKKHGRKAKSLFKYGLNYIASLLFSSDINNFSQCCKYL